MAEESKTDRRCNNPECGKRLTEDAPNWFQCSEDCRRAVWKLTEERRARERRDDDTL